MEHAPRDIWIDTDIIFNRFGEDVDDGLALMMALDHPDLRIHGISLCRGIDNGERVTERLLKLYARYPVPVFKGTRDVASGPGTRTPAVDALADALRARPMDVLAIGTATNLANLLQFHPDAAEHIRRIVFCAGRQASVRFTLGNRKVGLPDANVDNDPESMRQVIESGIPITLAGFEAAQAIWLHRSDITAIRSNGRVGDRWVAWRLWLWALAWRIKLGTNGFVPFDACTLGALLYPEQFMIRHDVAVAFNDRANDAPSFKAAANKTYLEVSETMDSSHRVDFAVAAKPEFKQTLMRHLLGTRHA